MPAMERACGALRFRGKHFPENNFNFGIVMFIHFVDIKYPPKQLKSDSDL
jgi:hypothetical protein